MEVWTAEDLDLVGPAHLTFETRAKSGDLGCVFQRLARRSSALPFSC